MAEQFIRTDTLSTEGWRAKYRFYYVERYYNKWMHKFKFPELNYQQKNYIMKHFWAEGTCSAISVTKADKELAGLIDSKEINNPKLLAFCENAPGGVYNIYDFYTTARPINKRGVKFIPETLLNVNEDIVIGYIQENHKSIFSSIEVKIEEIVDIEMAKRAGRKLQAQGFIFAGDPEDEKQLKKLQDQLEKFDPYIWVTLKSLKNFKAFSANMQYINDKLEQERQKCDNEVLTMLGVNNVGVMEKKEHLTTNEVDANNQDIEENQEAFTVNIEDWFERIKNAFGIKLTVIDLYEKKLDNKDEDKKPQKEEEENDGEN